MTLGTRLNQRATLQKARMVAMTKFLQEMASAEMAYCKAVKKGTERLETFLQSPDHNPEAPGSCTKEPADLRAALACVLKSLNRVADEHGSHAARAYNDAVGKLATLSDEYTAGTKRAITSAAASSKSVQDAEAILEKADNVAEKALTAFAASEGPWTQPDPWLSELARQRAADGLVTGMQQHQALLETVSRDFTGYESSGRSGFIRAIEDTISRVQQTSERVQDTLSHSYKSLRKMDCPQDNAYWQQFAETTVAQDTENTSRLWSKCSSNSLTSPSVEKHGIVSRPGVMKLTWSSHLAVLTNAGILHFFEVPPKVADEELPRLASAPTGNVALRDCTVNIVDSKPSSLRVEVILHSKLLPSTKYTLKLESEEAVVDWTVALKKHVPTDSVWTQRRQRTEDAKNDKFLQKRGTCSKPKANLDASGGGPAPAQSEVPEAPFLATGGAAGDVVSSTSPEEAAQIEAAMQASMAVC